MVAHRWSLPPPPSHFLRVYPFSSSSLHSGCYPGTFSNFSGAREAGPAHDASSKMCLHCPPGYECPRGTSDPIPCSPGRFSSLSSRSCAPCPAGSYCPQSAVSDLLTTTSFLCPAGLYCPSGLDLTPSLATHACPAGRFCPAGAFFFEDFYFFFILTFLTYR